MPPELVEVKRWLEKARNDRSAVKKIIASAFVETDIAAFHCQQAVEKLLKAFLVLHRVEFEKVHDLGLLLDQCVGKDETFESLRFGVEPLTLYAVAFRYPGPADPARDDVERALQVVEQVWDFVIQRMPDEVRT